MLGLYYLSIMRKGEPGEGKAFGNMAEIDHALAAGVITLATKIKGREFMLNYDYELVVNWQVLDGNALTHVVEGVLTWEPAA